MSSFVQPAGSTPKRAAKATAAARRRAAAAARRQRRRPVVRYVVVSFIALSESSSCVLSTVEQTLQKAALAARQQLADRLALGRGEASLGTRARNRVVGDGTHLTAREYARRAVAVIIHGSERGKRRRTIRSAAFAARTGTEIRGRRGCRRTAF